VGLGAKRATMGLFGLSVMVPMLRESLSNRCLLEFAG
jgi:hypothetical protein